MKKINIVFSLLTLLFIPLFSLSNSTSKNISPQESFQTKFEQNLTLGQITYFDSLSSVATSIKFLYSYIQSGTNTSRVQYALTTQDNWITLDNPDVTNNAYSFEVKNLIPETTYRVFLRVIDITTGDVSVPLEATGTTLNRCGIIDEIGSSGSTFNSISFSYYYTAGDGNSKLYYGYQEDFDDSWILLDKLDSTGAHSFTIFGLQPDSDYKFYFRTKNTNCLSNFYLVEHSTANTSMSSILYSKVKKVSSSTIEIDVLVQFNGQNSTLFYTLDNDNTDTKISEINKGNQPFMITFTINKLTPSTKYELLLIMQDDASQSRTSFMPEGGESLETLSSPSDWGWIIALSVIGTITLISLIYFYLRKNK